MPEKKSKATIEQLPAGYVTEVELYQAYRKAKVDTFYERDLNLSLEFAEFEKNLPGRLSQLFQRLQSGDWIDDPSVLGDCSFIPKSIDCDPPAKKDLSENDFARTVHTSADRSWKAILEKFGQKKPNVVFRPMSRSSIEWLVISSLWIMKAGHKLDDCLGESVRGSRLRRKKDGKFNDEAFGCFAPYAPAYGTWREDGLKAIRLQLKEHRGVIALTADLRSFYHSVDPEFLVTTRFKQIINDKEKELGDKKIGASLPTMEVGDWIFTEHVVRSYKSWANLHKDLFPDKKPLGLPIGPGATRVIANLVLLAFDNFIEREIQPLYYGRYVDDIFLVLRDGTGMKDAGDVWARIERLSELSQSSACRVKREKEKSGDKEEVCRLYLDYDLAAAKGVKTRPRSDLRFAGKKQKVFFIEGLEGQALLETIEHQVRANSSEWRHLPDLPRFDCDIHADFLLANADATETVDNLRKADRISIRRLHFALHLRDIEALAEDLTVKQWRSVKDKLFEFTFAHLVVLPEFFTYAMYFPRIMALAIQAQDWENASKLIRETAKTLDRVGADCNVDVRHLDFCRKDLGRKFSVTICRALPVSLWDSPTPPEGFQELIKTLLQVFPPSEIQCQEDFQASARSLFITDLGHVPFRKSLLYGSGAQFWTKPEVNLPDEALDSLRVPTIGAYLSLVKSNIDYVPSGMIFPTRPLSPPEITLLNQDLLDANRSEDLQEFVRAIRGTQFTGLEDVKLQKWRKWFEDSAGDDRSRQNEIGAIWIPAAESDDSVRICLPCLMVRDDSWVASIVQQPDPDLKRYIRITRAINSILSSHNRPHYIVMPELALKSHWFNRFAYKLEKSGISLISGIEYEHPPFEGINKDEVINSVRVSLVTNYPGYRTHLLYSQNKERPAPHEETELYRLHSKRLVAGKSGRKIIRHGDFQFGILICSELTNIDLRATLRGKVDALIVPQWNRDTEGFSSLVEATANDLHTFVIQSNNRKYGDSRIRGPYKDQWKRDILRLKGGIEDYYAIGEIHFMTLRRFQSSHRSPLKPFKPMPDGFCIHPSREELPLSESGESPEN